VTVSRGARTTALRGGVFVVVLMGAACKAPPTNTGGPWPCAGDGHLAGIGTDHACPAVVADIPLLQINFLTSAYHGKVAACTDAPFEGPILSGKVRVEDVVSERDATGMVTTVVGVALSTGGAECGTALGFTSRGEKVVMAVGKTYFVDLKTTSRTDRDVTTTSVLRDPSGKIAIATVVGARAETLESGLLKGLTLSVGSQPICVGPTSDVGHLARVTLSAGGSQCAGDSNTRTCCSLFGHDYDVQINNAIIDAPSLNRLPFVNFSIRAPDVVVAAP
jgi:hypothetical protein